MRRFCPPESRPTLSLALSVSPTRARVSSTLRGCEKKLAKSVERLLHRMQRIEVGFL